MNSRQPDTTPRHEPKTVSAAWLQILDLGLPAKAPPHPPLALRVFAGVADCMP